MLLKCVLVDSAMGWVSLAVQFIELDFHLCKDKSSAIAEMAVQYCTLGIFASCPVRDGALVPVFNAVFLSYL